VGYVKGLVSVPPIPLNFDEMKEYIVPTVSAIDGDMLQRIWHGSEYRIDVCFDRRGTYCASVRLGKR
jgi:hypothetical protein